MLVTAFVVWWYGGGWSRQAAEVASQLRRTADFFSLGLLLKTLFRPFRGISAEPVSGPLSIRVRAWFDRLLSRLIGAVVRLFTALAGAAALLLVTVTGGLRLAIWPLLPLAPLGLIILWLAGWVPWRN